MGNVVTEGTFVSYPNSGVITLNTHGRYKLSIISYDKAGNYTFDSKVVYIDAIVTENIKLLSSIKGLGKKTAERIVLELKDKVDQIDLFNFATKTDIPNGNINEAVEVLVSMGLTKFDANKLVRSVVSSNDTTEDIISKALRNMGNL